MSLFTNQLPSDPGAGGGTAYKISASIEGADKSISALSGLGRGLMFIELMSSRLEAAQIQEDRASTALQNLHLQMINTEMKLAAEEQKRTLISEHYQISLQRRAALVKEVENAERSGTGTSNQYAMAQIMLQQANADILDNQVRLAESNMQVAATQNQLTIETNNLDVQQKILALDQQRVNQMTVVQYLAYAQLGAAFISIIPSIIKATAALYTWVVTESAADIASVVASPWGIAALAILGIGAGVALAGISGGGQTSPTGTGGRATGGAVGRGQYGGIVTSPTMMLVGEAGPESINPIGSKGGKGGAIVNIHVGGGIIGGNERQLAEELNKVVNRGFDRYVRSLRG